MAAGTYDGVRELRSRLPEVPETVISYFLSKVSWFNGKQTWNLSGHFCLSAKYNVEECYEKLKNGYDDSADMSDFDGSLLYVPEGDRMTNAQTLTNQQDQAWLSSQAQQYPQEMSPSHFHAAPSLTATTATTAAAATTTTDRHQQQQLPYPADDFIPPSSDGFYNSPPRTNSNEHPDFGESSSPLQQ